MPSARSPQSLPEVALSGDSSEVNAAANGHNHADDGWMAKPENSVFQNGLQPPSVTGLTSLVAELRSNGPMNHNQEKKPGVRTPQFNAMKLPFYETVAKQLLDDGSVSSTLRRRLFASLRCSFATLCRHP